MEPAMTLDLGTIKQGSMFIEKVEAVGNNSVRVTAKGQFDPYFVIEYVCAKDSDLPQSIDDSYDVSLFRNSKTHSEAVVPPTVPNRLRHSK